MALKAHLISPASYRYLQPLGCLSLPHPRTLQKVYSNFGLESDFLAFLKQATSDFSDVDRNVILQMDEMSSPQLLIREEESRIFDVA